MPISRAYIGVIQELKRQFNLGSFIETGTYRGETSIWASKIFDRVITVEASRELYDEVASQYEYLSNIQFLYGDSSTQLQNIVQGLNCPGLFWLDAHWSLGDTYGEGSECPLLNEIEIINSADHNHFILINDARLFLSPPPKPHLIEQWPDISSVLEALNKSNFQRYIVIFQDIIIVVPQFAKSFISSYCQEINTYLDKERITQEIALKNQSIVSNKIDLREFNLVAFPNWELEENEIYEDLAILIRSIINHPNSNQISLLIDTNDFPQEDANLIVCDIIFNVLSTSNSTDQEPAVSLIGNLSEEQWNLIFRQVQARAYLISEDSRRVQRLGGNQLPLLSTDELVKLKMQINKLAPKRISTSLSDNQVYPQICIESSNDYKLFENFRQNPIYCEILEHVSEEQGQEYFRLIANDSEILGAIEKFKANDNYGNPVMYHYGDVGMFSPTTLRYIKVLADLKRYFKTLDDFHICEIGVGYGGQCRVINAYYKPSTYCLVDIQPALKLTQRYLDNYVIHSTLTYKTMNELSHNDYDLILSNYAFTELVRPVQDVYLHKVILNSRRGYITYNEITPIEFRSYKLDELLRMIPGSRILQEEPLTHAKNHIIIWGAN